MTNKILINLVIALLTTIILASCANNIITTNLDKKNFDRYFSAANVKVYSSEQAIKGDYQLITSVEGQDCQVKAHHAKPDIINARTQARRQAYNKQANGIVFSNCALLPQATLAQLNNSNEAKQCHAIIICYGKAYAIETK